MGKGGMLGEHIKKTKENIIITRRDVHETTASVQF